MSDTPTPYKPGLISRSRGAKLLIVCCLAVLMSIPAGFVFLLLHDRSHRAEEVADEIGGLMGGPQTFMGPVISVPYTAPVRGGDGDAVKVESGNLIVFPVSGDAHVTSKSEVRSRSLFRVPVYAARLNFTARFDLSQPAISQHLATLKDAGLVSGRREGRCVYYRVVPRGMKPLIDWIAHYRAFWTERVDRLEQLLEKIDE